MSDAPSSLTPPEIAHFLRATMTTLAVELSGVPLRVLGWRSGGPPPSLGCFG